MSKFLIWLLDKIILPSTLIYKLVLLLNKDKKWSRMLVIFSIFLTLVGATWNTILIYWLLGLVIENQDLNLGFGILWGIFSAFIWLLVFSQENVIPKFRDLKVWHKIYLKWYCRKKNKSSYAVMLRELIKRKKAVERKVKLYTEADERLWNQTETMQANKENYAEEIDANRTKRTRIINMNEKMKSFIKKMETRIDKIKLRIVFEKSLADIERQCPEFHWSSQSEDFTQNTDDLLQSVDDVLAHELTMSLEDLNLQGVDLSEKIETARQEVETGEEVEFDRSEVEEAVNG